MSNIVQRISRNLPGAGKSSIVITPSRVVWLPIRQQRSSRRRGLAPKQNYCRGQGSRPSVSFKRMGVLCVHCKSCGHRAALDKEKLAISRGNMMQLRDLRLRCEQCGTHGTA